MIQETMRDTRAKMDKAIEVAKNDLSSLRTGRANPQMFAKIMVDYYGAPTPLQQLASFQVPEARTVMVAPFDRSALNAIEKAISDSDLGVNPSNDGNTIRCVLPQLTEERRKEYIKMARNMGEEAKVSVRSVRRKAKDELDRLVKDGEIGEDEGARAEKDLEALTKEHTEKIDELMKHKEAELLEV